jgi:shikimate kinase
MLSIMMKVLITGMSGTGKSSVIAELARRGVRAIDTDSDEWSVWTRDPETGGHDWIWREDRIAELLCETEGESLVLSGCKSNQGRFYPLLDRIVLLTAPLDLLLYRVMHRTTNDYGKTRFDRFMLRKHVASVEPLLRSSADHVFDTAEMGIDEIAGAVEGMLSG